MFGKFLYPLSFRELPATRICWDVSRVAPGRLARGPNSMSPYLAKITTPALFIPF